MNFKSMNTNTGRVVTVFSPDGLLLQVEYAKKAAQAGSLTVGIRGADVIVLGAERRPVEHLQTERTVRKISLLDDHICMAFAGVIADARILMNRARFECKSYKLTVEEKAPIEYITKFIADLKQKYTHKHGVRPFGISCLIAGFDDSGKSHLYQTEPSGEFSEWKASALGQNATTVLRFLENHFSYLEVLTERQTVQLAIHALLQVFPHDSDDLEVGVMKRGQPLLMLSRDDIEEYMQEIDTDGNEAEFLQQEEMELL